MSSSIFAPSPLRWGTENRRDQTIAEVFRGVVETIGEDAATAGADDKAVPEKAPVDKLVKKDVTLVDLPQQASIGVLIALFVIGGCSALANFFEAGKSKGIVSSVLKCVNLFALNFSKKAGRLQRRL